MFTSITKKWIAGFTGLIMVSTTVNAGTVTESAIAKMPEVNGLIDRSSLLLEAGFDSEYYFRGLWFSSNNAWSGAILTLPFTEKLTFTPAVYYTESLDTNVPGPGSFKYAELDLSGSLNYDLGFAKLGMVYTYYNFFNTFSGELDGETYGFSNVPDSTITGAHDLGLTLTKSFGGLNATLGYWYDFKIAGKYMELAIDHPVKVNDVFSLIPSAAIGYGMDYYSYPETAFKHDGWNHFRMAVSAPIQLCPSTVLTPYVAGNFSLAARERLNTVKGKNDFYGGIKLGVTF